MSGDDEEHYYDVPDDVAHQGSAMKTDEDIKNVKLTKASGWIHKNNIGKKCFS